MRAAQALTASLAAQRGLRKPSGLDPFTADRGAWLGMFIGVFWILVDLALIRGHDGWSGFALLVFGVPGMIAAGGGAAILVASRRHPAVIVGLVVIGLVLAFLAHAHTLASKGGC